MIEKKYNEKQVAFIICANDEQEINECQFYLNQLIVPEGFTTDVITVSGATSMCEGYNAAMDSSDARYKVYLHQDTFIINRNFISDMLKVFEEDTEIGLLGVIGCRLLKPNAFAVNIWDTGIVDHNGYGMRLSGYQNGKNIEVEAVDGLIMITRYDVRWREDLFTKWDYYDISQCYEFHRIGKKVVVPYQEEPWCYHDNKYNVLYDYEIYRKVFINEYKEFNFENDGEIKSVADDEYELLKQKTLKIFIDLLNQGKIDDVCSLLNQYNDSNNTIGVLSEINTIKSIYELEQRYNSDIRFWNSEMNAKDLFLKYRKIRHILKRIEYGFEIEEKDISKLYSKYAMAIVLRVFCYDRKRVRAYLEKNYHESGMWGDSEHLIKERGIVLEDNDMKKSLYIIPKMDDVACIEKICNSEIANYVVISKKTETLKIKIPRITNVVNITAIEIGWYYTKEVFDLFDKVIIIGDELEDYVRLFYNTDMATEWYTMELKTCYGRTLSKNIIWHKMQ